MIIRAIREEEKSLYDQVVQHPLQTWAWGEFRKQTGVKVERIGFFEGQKLTQAFQVTFHKIPHFNQTIGYLPKGPMPDEEQLDVLRQLGEKHNALFVKLEPNIAQEAGAPSAHDAIKRFLVDHGCVPGRPLFTKYTFQLNLQQSEEKIFAQLKSKTRYNVRLAAKKGVQIFEKTSQEGMDEYIDILQETTNRQGFYAHSPEYFKTLWNTLGTTNMLHIFHAVYQDKIIVSWIVFHFHDIFYYPYGASRTAHRDVMASNLMMWEMIIYAKKLGCHTFDMWGSLGPKPDKNDPWYGFHKFKEGYGGTLTEFIGTYDLVLNEQMYKIYRVAENVRWTILRLRAKIGI